MSTLPILSGNLPGIRYVITGKKQMRHLTQIVLLNSPSDFNLIKKLLLHFDLES